MGEGVNLISIDVYLEVLHEIVIKVGVELLRHAKPTLKCNILVLVRE